MAETAARIARAVEWLRQYAREQASDSIVMEPRHFTAWDVADIIERQAAEITRLQSGGCARDQTTTQYCAEAAAFAAEVAGLRAEVERLRAELSAATGYMLNAKIDLETGAQKRTAIATIEGGLKRARAALPPAPESSDA